MWLAVLAKAARYSGDGVSTPQRLARSTPSVGSVAVGVSTLTRMPRWANSMASDWVKLSRPDLPVQYPMLPGSPWWAAVEVRLMIDPGRPWSTMRRMAARELRKAPSRMMASWRFHSSKGMSRRPFTLNHTAAFTRMSTGPRWDSTSSHARSTAASSATSTPRPTALLPRASMSPAARRANSGLRSRQATAAPARPNSVAMPAPMFGLVPVTTATFPARGCDVEELIRPFNHERVSGAVMAGGLPGAQRTAGYRAGDGGRPWHRDRDARAHRRRRAGGPHAGDRPGPAGCRLPADRAEGPAPPAP